MTTVLSILLSVTRGALLTAALIVLVRLAFRRVLTAKAKYYLWLLLALRFMLPVVPESPVSLLNFLPERTSVQVQSAPVAPRGPGDPDAVLWEGDPETVPEGPEVPNALVAADLPGTPDAVEEFPAAPEAPAIPEAPAAPGIPGTTILLWVWIAGMGLVLAVYGTLYIVTAVHLRRLPVCTDNDTLRVFLRLKRECGVRGRVRLVCGGAGMLGGLLRPTIVLPVEKHGEDVAPIIVHELMHYKYKDLWVSALLRLLTAVYWFNPVVWVCFHFAKLDGEAACDQRVLETKLVRPECYAGALYEEGVFSMKKNVLMQTTFGGSRHSLKRRIQLIAGFKSPKVWVTALAVILAAGITACTMTGAQSGGESASSGNATDAENGLTSAMDLDRETSGSEISSDPSDSSSEEGIANLAFSPYELSGDQIHFQNARWGMDVNEVFEAESLNGDAWNHVADQKMIHHRTGKDGLPDGVDDITYSFNWCGPDLEYGLNLVIVYYTEETTYDQLLAQRTEELGDPSYSDNDKATWETPNDSHLMLMNGKTVKERLYSATLPTLQQVLPTLDVEHYMESLQAPQGHFGWTFDQHVEAGLLNSENGEWEEDISDDGITRIFVTTIILDGEPYEAAYSFGPTLASDKEVLRQVFITLPEDVTDWETWANATVLSGTMMRKLVHTNTVQYMSPVLLSDLFSEEEQQRFVDEINTRKNITDATLTNWSLMWCGYMAGGNLWQYNGTGAALYLTAQDIE